MLDDMAFRNMSPATQKVYTYAVAGFARYHRTSPDKLGIEHVRDCRLHLLSRGLKARSINPIVGALRFFYGTTLGNMALADQDAMDYADPRWADLRGGYGLPYDPRNALRSLEANANIAQS